MQAVVRDLSTLDTLNDVLDEDGIREEVTLRAVKRVMALQLRQAGSGLHTDPTRPAREVIRTGTSTAL